MVRKVRRLQEVQEGEKQAIRRAEQARTGKLSTEA